MATNPTTENHSNEFDTLLAQSIEKSNLKEGSIIKGIITEIEDDAVIVDIAAKVEGRISKREFSFQKDNNQLAVGDEIDVYLEKIENQKDLPSHIKQRVEEFYGMI